MGALLPVLPQRCRERTTHSDHVVPSGRDQVSRWPELNAHIVQVLAHLLVRAVCGPMFIGGHNGCCSIAATPCPGPSQYGIRALEQSPVEILAQGPRSRETCDFISRSSTTSSATVQLGIHVVCDCAGPDELRAAGPSPGSMACAMRLAVRSSIRRPVRQASSSPS